jgi:hypothetical protein
MRFGGNTEPTGVEAVPPAEPVIAASRVVSPEVMLRTAVPTVHQIKLSATQPAAQSARTATPPTGRTATPQTGKTVTPQTGKTATPQAGKTAAAQPARTTGQPAPPAARGQSREFTGTLAVRSDPSGATVFVNSQRVGETPLQLTQVRAGTQVVWIERKGYQRWTTAARVVADTVTRIDVELEPERAPSAKR